MVTSTMYRSNWEELPKHQTLDELDTVNYQVTVTNTGSRSGAIAVLAYITFSVSVEQQLVNAVAGIESQSTGSGH